LASLKSDTARDSVGSNQFSVEIPVITESDTTAPEPMSIDFCHVNPPVTWNPWLICLVTWVCNPL
jgi:hypothetical protein